MDDELLVVLELAVAGLLFAYWAALFAAHTEKTDNAALLRDICYLLSSPEGTTVTGEYALDLCVTNGTIISRTPLGGSCLNTRNATLLEGPILAESACYRGRARLTLRKLNGHVMLLPGIRG